MLICLLNFRAGNDFDDCWQHGCYDSIGPIVCFLEIQNGNETPMDQKQCSFGGSSNSIVEEDDDDEKGQRRGMGKKNFF